MEGRVLAGRKGRLVEQDIDEMCIRDRLKRCRENGIGTAVETNLSLPFERMEGLLPYLDQVFFDIKLMDDAQHRQVTGISNATVLENAQRLAHSGIPAVVRTPLIPGITDTVENIGAIASFVRTLPNVRYYELLNFNPLGEEKYRALGLTCVHEGKRPLKKEALLLSLIHIWIPFLSIRSQQRNTSGRWSVSKP